MKELKNIFKYSNNIVNAKKEAPRKSCHKKTLQTPGQKTAKTHFQIGKISQDLTLEITPNTAANLGRLPSKDGREKISKGNSNLPLDRKIKNSQAVINTTNFNAQPKKKVFLGYREKELETSIAIAIAQGLRTAGYELYMGTRKSICQGNSWTEQIESEYQQCDGWIILLSQESLISELMAEGFKRAMYLLKNSNKPQPMLLGIRVNISSNTPVIYELQSYLNLIQQWDWNSWEDTGKIVEAICDQLSQAKSQPKPRLNISSLTDKKTPNNFFYSPEHQPLPCVKPELPTADVAETSTVYVERVPYQEQCYQTVVKPGAMIRIVAPKQMGKTSLLNRILAYAKEQNYHRVLLNFQQLEPNILGDLNQLVRWFCTSIASQLNLPANLEDYWDDDIGIKASSSFYLQSYILKQIDTPIVIALEEVSAIFTHIAVTQDFFTLLRFWHEKAKINHLWAKIRLIMVQSTEAYIPLTINQSPLNVGLGINLPPFSFAEVEYLVRQHQLNLTPQEIKQLMQLLAGHPYLIRLSLYHLSGVEFTVSSLLETAASDTSVYSDHLHRLLWKLQQHPELASAFRRVLHSSVPVRLEYEQGVKLKSLGLVSLDNEQYTVSCDLYRLFFSQRLIN